MNKKIAIVILNWNGIKFLQQFLSTVVNYSSIAKIIIGDNNSSDESVNYLKLNFNNITIIQNTTNDGFALGYNKILSQVDSEYYVLLNSDVAVTPNWLEPMLNFMESHPNVAACQPTILDYNQKHMFEYAGAAGGFIDQWCYPFCRGRIFNHLEKNTNQYKTTQEVFWASGACLFIKSKLFWKVGGFDSDYFAHMEEIDICWRLKNIGYQIYFIPYSTVYHVGGGTLHKLSPNKTFLNFRNNLITFLKNAPPNFLFFKLIWRLILDALAAIKFLFEGQFFHFISVIRAHISFYAQLIKTLQKRKVLRSLPEFKQTNTGILFNNIVYLHFIKRIKKFSDINWSK